MADQPDKKSTSQDQGSTPEEIKDSRKIQPEEVFGWTPTSEGEDTPSAETQSPENEEEGRPTLSDDTMNSPSPRDAPAGASGQAHSVAPATPAA